MAKFLLVWAHLHWIFSMKRLTLLWMGCKTILGWNLLLRPIINLHCVIVLLEEWRLSPANNQVHEILIFKSVTRQKNSCWPILYQTENLLSFFVIDTLILLSGWNSVPCSVKRGIAWKWHKRCGTLWKSRWCQFGEDQPSHLLWVYSR